MPITISSGTTTVSNSTGSSYIVEGSGTLDVVSGGIVSGLITISSGGTVNNSSSGGVLSTTISHGGIENVSSGGTAGNTTVSSGGT
jgi:autotransporter passenger strand-loop-strand repeat protein